MCDHPTREKVVPELVPVLKLLLFSYNKMILLIKMMHSINKTPRRVRYQSGSVANDSRVVLWLLYPNVTHLHLDPLKGNLVTGDSRECKVPPPLRDAVYSHI